MTGKDKLGAFLHGFILTLVGILILYAIFCLLCEWQHSRGLAAAQAAYTKTLAIVETLDRIQVAQSRAAALPDPAFLIWPIHPQDYKRISSPFGIRNSPIYGGQYRLHRGVDIVGLYRSRIRSAGSGYISDVYPAPGGKWKGHKTKGGYVEITHAGGWVTRYSHMNEVFKKWWVIGTPIKAGQDIGRQGNTGLSVADHLHYEVLKNGIHQNPLKYTKESEG